MKRKRFLIGGLLIFAAIGYLGYVGFMGSAAYYYTVNEFVTKKATMDGATVRIGGVVASGSVVQEAGGRTLKFAMVEGNSRLNVVYKGIVPDTFKAGAETVIEGRLDSAGTFQATTLMPKCASKYESQ